MAAESGRKNDSETLLRKALDNLDYDPMPGQRALLEKLSAFALERRRLQAFILRGYAGTGKTSLTAAFVKALRECGLKFVLLAPTGRAAKVFSSYAGMPAHTIHKRLFRGDLYEPGSAGTALFNAPNDDEDTLFIVDEASMIQQDSQSQLLTLLLRHIYSREGDNVVFIGDTAQLPPVGQTVSHALSEDYLRGFGMEIFTHLLDAPARQAQRSGILYNATWLRRAMALPELPSPQLRVSGFCDVKSVSSEYLQELVADSYSETGEDGTMVITRSNFRAGVFNRGIRATVLYAESELQIGERLVVVKNNYHYARKIKELGFIANGEIIHVKRIRGIEDRYGSRFADVEAELPSAGISLDAKLILDTLSDDTASLSGEALTKLYNAILAEKEAEGLEFTRALAATRRDPYMNALQVKYAYCLTCHKAQGGQWENLFVDLGGIQPETMDMEFYRWLYTAVTRARRKLFLVNPTLKTV